jgi:lipoprotein-anchoring transpeptidase ErfK/SrfK
MQRFWALSWWIGLAAVIVGAAFLAWRQAAPPPHTPTPGALAVQWWPTPGTRIGIRAPVRAVMPFRVPSRLPPGAWGERGAPGTRPVVEDHAVVFRPPAAGWPPHQTLRFWIRPNRFGVPPAVLVTATAETLTTDDDRRLVVNLTRQELYAYQGPRLVKSMPVSTGVAPDYATPTGRFWIWRRVRLERMVNGRPGSPDYYAVPHVPFSQYIYRGIAIHGAYWNRQFGVPKSHGCIQVATRLYNPRPSGVPEDAGWLWHFTHLGDPVTVTGTTPPRPTAPAPYPPPAPRSASPAGAYRRQRSESAG